MISTPSHSKLKHLRKVFALYCFLVIADLRNGSASGRLNWGWILAQPIAQITLYSVVFGIFMSQRGTTFATPGSYIVYLCSGFFCWLGFSETLSRASTAQIEGSTLIKGRGIPPILFPLKAAGAAWTISIIGIILTLIMAPFAGVTPVPAWFVLPLLVMSLIILSMGIALVLSPITTLDRNVSRSVNLLLPLIFWATPVVYEPSILPAWAQKIQVWNPLFPGITSIHELLLFGITPSTQRWCEIFFISVSSLAVGSWAARRLDSMIRDVL